jgi:hypothetical protein
MTAVQLIFFCLQVMATAKAYLSLQMMHQTNLVMKNDYMLLICQPFGILADALDWNPTAVFILNLLTIVLLAMLLSLTTEELCAKAGQVLSLQCISRLKLGSRIS